METERNKKTRACEPRNEFFTGCRSFFAERLASPAATSVTIGGYGEFVAARAGIEDRSEGHRTGIVLARLVID
jgi:hypothetical protein